MLPATSPEPQKIAKPASVIITRPRRPIFGIPDGLGRSSRRGLLSSLILSLMLGFQYARKETGGLLVFLSNRDPVIFRGPAILAVFRAVWPRFCPVQTPFFSEIFLVLSGSRVR